MLKLKNKKEIERYLREFAKKVEKALIFNLEYLVTELENHAKASAGYKDQTANLKSSIGGVVLKNGRPISYKGFAGSPKGTSTGRTFLQETAQKYTSGYVLLIVAGMNYATYVENFHGLNVLKKSELRMQRELPLMLAQLKSKLAA